MHKANDLMQQFEKHIISTKLVTPEMKIIIGVSGGSDSTALLYLLYHLRAKYKLSLLAVHINHNLRNNESYKDELFVRNLCMDLNIPLIVRQIKFTEKRDLENKARILRREIFKQVLDTYKFDKIALGHQMNDQCETVLMNFIRGAGITGLGGIKENNGYIIRPLLPFCKDAIESWMISNGYRWRIDNSNRDLHFTRNIVRAELIPWIKSNLNQSIVEKIVEQTKIFQKADDWLKEHVLKCLKKLIIESSNDEIVLDIKMLLKLSEIELYYVLRYIYSQLSGTTQEFFMHNYEEIKRILPANGCKRVPITHNIQVVKQYNELLFLKINFEYGKPVQNELIIEEDRTHFTFQNWRFSIAYLKNLPSNYKSLMSKHNVFIDLNKVVMPLKLRTRKSGDRFIPSGMLQMKKLKDFFIDEKVPRLERDKVPLLTDAEKIVWVVGYRLDHRALCIEETHKVAHIKIEPAFEKRKRAAQRTTSNQGGKLDIYEL